MAQTTFHLVSEQAPLIAVPVLVNGKGPFTFVLDTGASHVVVSPELAQQLTLSSSGSEDMGKGIFGHIEAKTVTLDSIGVDGAVTEECSAVIMDIEGIRQAMGGDADGILGYSYLKDFRLTIDYPRSTIVFERAKT